MSDQQPCDKHERQVWEDENYYYISTGNIGLHMQRKGVLNNTDRPLAHHEDVVISMAKALLATPSSIESPDDVRAMVEDVLELLGIPFDKWFMLYQHVAELKEAAAVSAIKSPSECGTRLDGLKEAYELAGRVRVRAVTLARGRPEGDEQRRWESHGYGADEVAYNIRQLIEEATAAPTERKAP